MTLPRLKETGTFACRAVAAGEVPEDRDARRFPEQSRQIAPSLPASHLPVAGANKRFLFHMFAFHATAIRNNSMGSAPLRGDRGTAVRDLLASAVPTTDLFRATWPSSEADASDNEHPASAEQQTWSRSPTNNCKICDPSPPSRQGPPPYGHRVQS